MWDKLLSFHWVVSFADCDTFENASYKWVLDRDRYAGQINQTLDNHNKQESPCGLADWAAPSQTELATVLPVATVVRKLLRGFFCFFFLMNGYLLTFQMTLLLFINRMFTLHIIESVNRNTSISICSLLQWWSNSCLLKQSPVVVNLHFHSAPFVDIPCIVFLGSHKVSLAS